MNDMAKPCPFCGGNARTWKAYGDWYATCNNLECAFDGTMLLADWNNRVIEDKLLAQIADLLNEACARIPPIDELAEMYDLSKVSEILRTMRNEP